MTIETELVLESESVTDAVITWVPAERVESVNDPPEPITSSRSDNQTIDDVISPSVTLVAVPVKVIAEPSTETKSSVGATIDTVGMPTEFIVILWEREPVLEPESVTDAVITWLPAERVESVNDPPEYITPSRSDDHTIDYVISPSVTLVAVPVKVIAEPST